MRRIGSFTANQIRKKLGVEHPVWQRDGFYDRACRNDSEVLNLAEYIEHNPIRKGFVEKSADWLFSSATQTGERSWIGIGGLNRRSNLFRGQK